MNAKLGIMAAVMLSTVGIAPTSTVAQQQAEKITCHFIMNEKDQSIATTLVGETGQPPSWIAQTIALRSGWTNEGIGIWIGAADLVTSHRVSQISISIFQWNGKPAGGISILSAPILDAVSVGMMEVVHGSRSNIAPDPVLGVLKIDGKTILSKQMTPRDLPDGKFLELSTGYLARHDENTPYGVEPEAQAALQTLISATGSATLELYQILDHSAEAPNPGQQPLVSFGYPAALFQSAVALSQQNSAAALAEFAKECPNHKVPT